jgi:hypothetical protein
MLAAFVQLRLLWQVLTILGALGAAGGLLSWLYTSVRHQGFVEGEASARAECEAEKAAQRKANQDAIDAGNRRLIRLADELSTTEMETDHAVAAALAAAAADPTGDSECLPLGSVQRLQTIR